MPLCTLHLLSLHTSTPNPLSTFISTLKSTNLTPLVVSRILRWIILPTALSTDALLARNIHWDLLLILPSTAALPPPLQTLVHHQWSLTAGIPSRLTHNFAAKNNHLLHPDPASIPPLARTSSATQRAASSSQNLQLSPDLHSWITSFSENGGAQGRGAVSMLNLLAFRPNMKARYLEYGAAFASDVGAKRGGNAKLVGTVVEVEGEKRGEGEGGWDEIALAHYPSIRHFADMLGDSEYQEANLKWRVPALRDTFILCTSEIGVEELGSGLWSKL